MPPPNRIGDILIYKIQHLTQFKNSDDGARTLERIANIMKPLLREHNWKVGMLAEFLPVEAGLLGLNTGMGHTIHVRMRHHSDPNQFLPFESIMDTALHEMCHNTFGPHDADFHKMWDQMRDEYVALMRTGFTGNYFTGPGHYVGGKVTRTEARRIVRVEAAKAAPKGLLPINRKLGGAPPPRIRDRADMAATIAASAEKRMGMICGNGRRTPEKKKLIDDASKNSKVIEIVDDEDEIAIQIAFMELAQEEREREARQRYGGSGKSRDEPMNLDSSPAEAYDARKQSYPAPKASYEDTVVDDDPRWPCKTCTYLNQPSDLVCQVCDAPATSKPSRSMAEKQKQALDDAKRWPCRVCTKLNPPSTLTCQLCGTPATKSTNKLESVKQEKALKDATKWECIKCTLLNEPRDRECAACGSGRAGGASNGAGSSSANLYLPGGPSQNSSAYNVGAGGSSMKAAPKPRVLGVQTPIPIREAPKTWTCRNCTREMDSQWWTCDTCGVVKARP